jgi:hypothetical protein
LNPVAPGSRATAGFPAPGVLHDAAPSLPAHSCALRYTANHVRDCDLTGHVADMSKSTLMTHLRRSTEAAAQVASCVIFRTQTPQCLTLCTGSRLPPGEELIDPSTTYVDDLEAQSIISEDFPTSGRWASCAKTAIM